MAEVLLDTDTLSEVMKGRNPLVLQHATRYLAAHGHFTFSLITRFEVLRGLKSRGAAARLASFEVSCPGSAIISISDEIVVKAADLYAQLKRQGQLISDADLLIAATALVGELALVTSNTGHFSRIPGLQLECWT